MSARRYKVLIGDCLDSLRTMPSGSVHTCVTSPPYLGLRDYGVAGQIGLESTPDEFVAKLVEVFREVHRVLRDDGTLWLNLGDSYVTSPPGNVGKVKDKDGAYSRRSTMQTGHGEDIKAIWSPSRASGLPNKSLLGMPWRVAFALQDDGWLLRQDIIWHKPNPMPESTRDRCTKAHEYIFLLSKRPKYYFDHEAFREPALKGSAGSFFHKGKTAVHALGRSSNKVRVDTGSRNRRSVWTVSTKPYKGAHFATFPPDLIEPCILAGCPEGGTVLDPFGGSGTTAGVAVKHRRRAILCELKPEYAALIPDRVSAIVRAKK